MSRFGVFTINGVDYDLDDLTLDEVEQIEERAGAGAFTDMNFGGAKTMKAIAYTLMRRTSPELEWSEVGKVKLLDFMPPDEEVPDSGPPVEEAAENGSASEPAAAGVLRSVESPVTSG